MAIRVDRGEFGRSMDPGAVGSSASGAQVYDDGLRMAPWEDRPWKDRREIQASETMRLMSIPSDAIRAIRPPVPYILFPNQELGFVPEALTIEEVLDTDRWAPKQRSWLSPTIQPTRRADYQDQTWSGTARGVGMSVNPML